MNYFLALSLLLSIGAQAATSRESAYKLHNRLTGVPPKPQVLKDMEDFIDRGQPEEAAKIAMNHKNFINVVLKNWVKPWSNRDQTSRVPLNDYVATVLGSVKDNVPFDRVLYDDIIYVVNGAETNYSPDNNTHYSQAETANADLSTRLIQQTQSQLTGIGATSGIMTTRAAGESFYSAGTNRRINRYTFMNFLCRDYEDMHDTSIPDTYVRQDVERNPGLDSRTYKNKCVGCHAGQDSLAGAYAYYNFANNRLTYTPNTVTPKINQIVYYREGHRTVNDSWMNMWVMGKNAKELGWSGANSGSGARDLNRMFTRSNAFSQCMAKKVYKLVCMKDPESASDKAFVEEQSRAFKNGFSLKNLILKTSVGCIVNE